MLKTRLARIPNVVAEPAPGGGDPRFHDGRPGAGRAPVCHNDHYWQVYFDTNRLIADSFGEAGSRAQPANRRAQPRHARRRVAPCCSSCWSAGG